MWVCAHACACVLACVCSYMCVHERGGCVSQTDRQTDGWVFRSQGVTEAVPDTSRAEVCPDSRYAWRFPLRHAESAPKPLPGPVPLNLQRNTGH